MHLTEHSGKTELAELFRMSVLFSLLREELEEGYINHKTFIGVAIYAIWRLLIFKQCNTLKLKLPIPSFFPALQLPHIDVQGLIHSAQVTAGRDGRSCYVDRRAGESGPT